MKFIELCQRAFRVNGGQSAAPYLLDPLVIRIGCIIRGLRCAQLHTMELEMANQSEYKCPNAGFTQAHAFARRQSNQINWHNNAINFECEKEIAEKKWCRKRQLPR